MKIFDDNDSNKLLEEWGKLLCDVPTTGTINDRLLHHAKSSPRFAKNYRFKEAPVATQEYKENKRSNEPATAGAASQDSLLGTGSLQLETKIF